MFINEKILLAFGCVLFLVVLFSNCIYTVNKDNNL